MKKREYLNRPSPTTLFYDYFLRKLETKVNFNLSLDTVRYLEYEISDDLIG